MSFQVLVKETKRKVLPTVTDEWAAEVSEFDTAEALQADIATRPRPCARAQAQPAVREKVPTPPPTWSTSRSRRRS